MTMTQPFHFPDGRIANNAKDLLELCEQYPDDATGFLVRQDLEKWLAYIGDYDVAECAANARQIDVSDRQKLEDFLNKCHSLTAPQPVPSAMTETKIEGEIEENLSVPESASTTIESPQEQIANATVARSEALEAAEESLEENLSAPESASTTIESPQEQIADATVARSEALEAAEESLAEAIPPRKPAADQSSVKTSVSSSATNDEEKLSFFQVVAKFFVKIFYRNKA
jgi:hypothetical protein